MWNSWAHTASGVVRDVIYLFFSSLQPGRVVTLIEDDDVSGIFCFLLVYSRNCSGVSSLHQLIEW